MSTNSWLLRTVAVIFLGPIMVISAAFGTYYGLAFAKDSISFFLFPDVYSAIRLVIILFAASIFSAGTFLCYMVLKNLFASRKKE